MNKINRQELAKAIHENAVAKGFWDEKYFHEHYLMLVITELSEAVEAYRKDRKADREAYDARSMNGFDSKVFELYIKDTVADELADAYIRLLDLAEGFDWDVKGQKEKHAGIFLIGNFTTDIFTCVRAIVNADYFLSVEPALLYIEAVCDKYSIDLTWHINEKMKYNATRPHLHGKKC